MLKKRINTILEILRLSKQPFIFLGSYNNPDFKHFSDVDVDLIIDRTPDLAQKIKNRLPQNIALHSLKLQETETSFAEWYASDN